MEFRATLEQHGKSATGIEVPASVLDGLGGGKRAAVQVTINGYTYRTSIGAMGGRSLIPVSADVRGKAGVAAGDSLAVRVELDDAPRTVTVPPALAEALDREPLLRKTFDALSYSRQQRHALAVEGAKTDATRDRRVAAVLDELRSA
jgi:hypothetical protein